jgi:hypothetical protein
MLVRCFRSPARNTSLIQLFLALCSRKYGPQSSSQASSFEDANPSQPYLSLIRQLKRFSIGKGKEQQRKTDHVLYIKWRGNYTTRDDRINFSSSALETNRIVESTANCVLAKRSSSILLSPLLSFNRTKQNVRKHDKQKWKVRWTHWFPLNFQARSAKFATQGQSSKFNSQLLLKKQ